MRLLEHPVSSLHAACPHPVLGHAAAKRGHGSTCISGVSAIGDNYFLIAAFNSPVSLAHNTLRDRAIGRQRERRRLRRMLCTYVCVCVCLCLCLCLVFHVCMSVCMRICVCFCVYLCIRTGGGRLCASKSRAEL
jgi:hypothetical protein